jgi:two-component system LytT family sensor kinase
MSSSDPKRIELSNHSARDHKWRFVAVVVSTIIILATSKMLYFKIGYFLETGTPIVWADVFASSDAIYGLISTTLVALVYLAIDATLKRAFAENNVALRYTLSFFLTAVIGGGVAASHMYFYLTVIYEMDAPANRYVFDSAVQAFITPLTLIAALETFHYRGAWLQEQFKREQQKKEMVSAKFEALSNQLSPHFVFNSFNTLGGLISENPSAAEGFLNELSNVYRYILDNKDKETVPLRQELASAQSFLAVQEARHPGTVKININIDRGEMELRIIPLTIHTLIENVFKHNKLTKKHPINISIHMEADNALIIANTVNQKLEVESHKIGIANLSKRYEFLARKGIDIIRGNDLFSVKIPALNLGDLK